MRVLYSSSTVAAGLRSQAPNATSVAPTTRGIAARRWRRGEVGMAEICGAAGRGIRHDLGRHLPPEVVPRSCSPAAPQPLSPASGFQHDLFAVVFLVVEHPVALGGLIEGHAVRDDERRVDVSALDALEE